MHQISNGLPLVSVLVNCFNGEKYINRAIDSVLAQSYQNWEIIFWDNQSTDNTAKIINSYFDSRIKYFYAGSHTLLYDARNFAYSKSCGELIAFLDADDWWVSTKLEKQVSIFKNSGIDAVYSNYFIFNQKLLTSKLAFKKILPSGKIYPGILKNYPVNISTLIFRRTLNLTNMRPFDPRFHIIGDFDFVCRISKYSNIGCIQDPLIYYRVHSNSESSKKHTLLIKELKLWASEQSLSLIGSKKARHPIQDYIDFLEGDAAVQLGNKSEAFKIFKQMPLSLLKVKLFALLIMPISIIRKYRNLIKPLDK